MENGKYADYAYYTKNYLGTEITAEKFGPIYLPEETEEEEDTENVQNLD